MRPLLAAARRIVLGVLLVSTVLTAAAALGALVTGNLAPAAVLAALAVLLAGATAAERRGRRLEHLAARSDRRLKALGTAVQQQEAALQAQLTAELDQVRLADQDAAERQDRALATVQESLDEADRALSVAARDTLIGTVVEQTALLNLFTALEPPGTLPAPTDFSAMPSTMLEIVTHVLSLPHDPLVVECGSGASTVWFALACRRRGGGHVVALEHDAHYAEQTRAALERCGVADYAEVRHAPVEPQDVAGERFRWYGAGWDDLQHIDVLFVDGPPGRTGPLARYPAMPLLADRLTAGALVVMDDAKREDEAAALTRWLDETGGRLTRLRTPGRTAFLRWS